jgi:ATP-dependent Zn protease
VSRIFVAGLTTVICLLLGSYSFGPNKVTTGARSDMWKATEKARLLCTTHSLSSIGLSTHVGDKPSQATQAAIEAEVERILQASYERVTKLMKLHRTELDHLAGALVRLAANTLLCPSP